MKLNIFDAFTRVACFNSKYIMLLTLTLAIFSPYRSAKVHVLRIDTHIAFMD